MAKREGFHKVTCAHKANIMKLTDGLFLETFYEVAKEYPEIEANDMIVDDLAMKLVAKPQQFEIVVLTNLQGDIMSDLCAGLVGGLGSAPSANVGEHISIFEAVHGTAPDITGKNIANPTALLLSGFMMLRYLGFMEQANLIENALLYTLENGVHTGDFGDRTTPSLSTTEFAQAIISNLGKSPKENAARDTKATSAGFHKPVAPSEQKIMLSHHNLEKSTVVGVDLFIESSLTAADLAPLIQKHLIGEQKLIMISNRGTQVWPTGSVFTECVDQYRARIEVPTETSLEEMFALSSRFSTNLMVSSVEILRKFGEKAAYSLAQGQ
jgi:isocitrate dehydrogenase